MGDGSFRQDPQKALELYRDRGFHVEENHVTDELINRTMAAMLDYPNAKDGIFAPIPMPHRVHPIFLEFLRYEPTVRIVEQIVGGTASGLGGDFFYMKPGTPGFANHQDNWFIDGQSADAVVSAWTALCDVTAENGALDFFPGSHQLGLLPIRDLDTPPDPGQTPTAQAMECMLPEGFPPFTVEVKRGSTVFFHSLLVHASNRNRSDRFRYSYLATYIRKGVSFRAGQRQRRTEIELHERMPA